MPFITNACISLSHLVLTAFVRVDTFHFALPLSLFTLTPTCSCTPPHSSGHFSLNRPLRYARKAAQPSLSRNLSATLSPFRYANKGWMAEDDAIFTGSSTHL